MSSTSFDAARFARDHGLPTAPPGHKHNREGWVNVACPFCTGNPGYHLGMPGTGFAKCHRCGWHKVTKVIGAVVSVPWDSAQALFARYGGRPEAQETTTTTERPQGLTLPPGCGPMGSRHRKYLEGRGYDAGELEAEWGLLGTGHTGPYKFRVIAPIMHGGRLVSYQGRDITGKSPLKYKACPQDEEVIPHRELLYGLGKVPGHTVVVVEGVTDVWRLGPGSVCTFGIQWSMAQALLLKRFPRRFVLFDAGEEQAAERGLALARVLAGFGGHTELLELDASVGDPADMGDDDARRLMGHLGV